MISPFNVGTKSRVKSQWETKPHVGVEQCLGITVILQDHPTIQSRHGQWRGIYVVCPHSDGPEIASIWTLRSRILHLFIRKIDIYYAILPFPAWSSLWVAWTWPSRQTPLPSYKTVRLFPVLAFFQIWNRYCVGLLLWPTSFKDTNGSRWKDSVGWFWGYFFPDLESILSRAFMVANELQGF